MQIVVDNGEANPNGPRILAPGAPPSPGPIPNALAKHLNHGEVLVWWGQKTRMQIALVGLSLAAAAVTLLVVTGFAPTFWTRGIDEFGPPVAALLSPTLFVLYREWVARQTILVTDGAIVAVDPHDEAQRLSLGGLTSIRRDWLRGGVRIEGSGITLFIPSVLVEPTRKALVSRYRGRLRAAGTVTDPLGWLP